jgi:hypothetical protein
MAFGMVVVIVWVLDLELVLMVSRQSQLRILREAASLDWCLGWSLCLEVVWTVYFVEFLRVGMEHLDCSDVEAGKFGVDHDRSAMRARLRGSRLLREGARREGQGR